MASGRAATTICDGCGFESESVSFWFLGKVHRHDILVNIGKSHGQESFDYCPDCFSAIKEFIESRRKIKAYGFKISIT